LVHPPDRLVAYLRYFSDLQSYRKREGRSCRRVYRLEEQRKILDKFQVYMGYDPVFGLEAQGLPKRPIRKIYNPCFRLAEILEKRPKDLLEENALTFANLLKNMAFVPMSSLRRLRFGARWVAPE
jgi:predicted nucleotidyltransferase